MTRPRYLRDQHLATRDDLPRAIYDAAWSAVVVFGVCSVLLWTCGR